MFDAIFDLCDNVPFVKIKGTTFLLSVPLIQMKISFLPYIVHITYGYEAYDNSSQYILFGFQDMVV